MEISKVDEITDKLERHLSLNTKNMEKYDRYREEGKEAALRGELRLSDKLMRRIQAIQDLIQREEEEDVEEDEFVDVNNSGLKLYKELYNKLYEHQKEGVAFLYSLHRDERKGGILADDMGLGKTIQVISFLSGMYDAELANHTLLVMPTSLIKNWVREFAKWTPGMRVKEFHGSSKTERNRNLERIQHKGGVVITTYQMLINNFEQLASYNQHEFIWDYVILDEAHKIKTSSTKTAKSTHAIPAKNRVLLTGTPVQNNLREMWALFDFACQGSLLGTAKTFKAEYENPITRAREKDATPGEKALGLKISQNLMDIIKPHFLRRTKADVQHKKQKREEGFQDEENQENKCPNVGEDAEMPSLTRKNDLIVWTYLSSKQEDIYKQFLSLDQVKQLLLTNRSPLTELTVLKKLCDHPLLSHRAVTQLGLEQGSASRYINLEDESESAVSLIDHISDDTLIQESGKLQFLVSLLECLREEGHRTLIFSQSRKMLDIMERVLRNRNFRLLRLDGTVTQLAEREKRITLFQTDKRYTIFLLTTLVGGVGITLTAANRVVIFDPSWNPATDAQAVDRAYRIGQTENVIIYRLITCGTVEEKIYRRQVFKDSLIRQTTGDKQNPYRYFSKQELHELFKLADTRSSSTQQQLQAMHSHYRLSDTRLDQHIARLHSMEMFGISDHDLMFTKEVAAHEDDPEDAESHHYIQTRVQKAQELMQAESELHGQLMDSVAQNTEPAWLRQMGQPKSAGRDHPARPHQNEPVTVDLTHNSFDEPEPEEGEKNFLSVEEEEVEFVGEKVEVVSEEKQVENKSPRSGKEVNLHIVKGQVSPVAEKLAQVITLDNSSDEADKSYDDKASRQKNSLHSLPSPSHHLPELEELSVASDAFDNGEVQADKLRSTVLSSPPSPHESRVGESEVFQGNFNLQLEDNADMFSVKDEEACEMEESQAEESPEFQLQMDTSGERLEEASVHESGQDANQNNSEAFNHSNPEIRNSNSEVSQHESFSKIHSAPNTPADDSFVHSVRRKKRQIISDTEEEDEEVDESEKPCLTSSPLVEGLMKLGCSTPKSTLTDGTRLLQHLISFSLNTSVASRRSFVVSMLENESDDESDKNQSYDTSEASDIYADEPVEEEEPPSGDKSGFYERSQASEAHTEESLVEEEEPTGETLNTDESRAEDESGDQKTNDTSAEESVEEEELHSREKSESYDRSQASEAHADELLVKKEEPNEETLNTEESEKDEELEEEEQVETRGEQKANETYADESALPEEEPSGDKTESYQISETSEAHADESPVEEEEPTGETLNTDDSRAEDESGDQKTNDTSAEESVEEEELHSREKSESYDRSQASEADADELLEKKGEPNEQTLNTEESEKDEELEEEEQVETRGEQKANETYADESALPEEEPSGDKTESYQISEASEAHADESLVEEEESTGETLNTEESERDELLEKEEPVDSRDHEQEEWHSTLLESTDIELDSSEMMDQCAPKTIPSEMHILHVSSTNAAAKASADTYESLVMSGKKTLAEGRKQEALDFFLKAIDVNIGDAEIQLLIIQLYRQLNQ